MYNVRFVRVHRYVQKILCLHNADVFMYMFPIMIIKVRKDLEYSDTNEIINLEISQGSEMAMCSITLHINTYVNT